MVLIEHVQCVLPIEGGQGLMPRTTQHRADELVRVLVVLGDEDARHEPSLLQFFSLHLLNTININRI